MDIAIHNFVLKPCIGSTTRFDIYEVIKRTKKKEKDSDPEETYDAEKDFGFGCTLENAIHKMISDRLANRKGVVTLQEYLIQYKSERSEILNIINQLTKS